MSSINEVNVRRREIKTQIRQLKNELKILDKEKIDLLAQEKANRKVKAEATEDGIAPL